MHHNLSVLQWKKNLLLLEFELIFLSIQDTKKNAWEKWGDIGTDYWFTEVSVPAAPRVGLPQCFLVSVRQIFSVTRQTVSQKRQFEQLPENKLCSFTMQCFWCGRWNCTVGKELARLLRAILAQGKARGTAPQLCQENGISGQKGKLARSCATRFPH